MIKHLWIALILLLFSSCYKNDKAAAGYQAIKEFSRKKCKENMWQVQVCGGGFSGDDFNLVLGFLVYDQFYTVSEAREIYVKTMEDFLGYLNNNPKIKKYSTQFPLTYKNVEISISFRDSHKKYVNSQYIDYIYSARNTIFYDVREYTGTKYTYKTVHTESYEDALSKVTINPN